MMHKRHNSQEDVINRVTKKTFTVLLYSPDIDFCASFRFLFQDRYNVVTITDPKMLLGTVHELNPALVIVDSAITELMRHRFEIMKCENPHIRIMLLYAVHFNDNRIREDIRHSVDAAFSKPIDLSELTASMGALMSQRN